MKLVRLVLIVCFLGVSIVHAQQNYYDANPGNGYGFRLWGANDYYKVHMGNSSDYKYGPVTDYSIKVNMSPDNGRGWTWGIHGATPVAAISNTGQMQLAGNFYSLGTSFGLGTNAPSNVYGHHAVLDIRGASHSKIAASSNSATYITAMYSDSNWSGLGGGFIGTETNHDLFLMTNHVPRLALNTAGYVGIGTTSPAARMHISNSNAREALRVYLDGNTTNYLSMWQGIGAGVIDPIGTGVLQFGYDQTTNVIMGVSSSGTNNIAKTGIGTNNPLVKLDVRGDFLLDTGTNPVLYTGTGSGELNRFLQLINSPGLGTASGLKAGGVLVADNYSYASPGKNDMIVKGNVGIGTANASTKIHVAGGGIVTSLSQLQTLSAARFDVGNPAISLNIGYVSTDIPFIQASNNVLQSANNLTLNPFGGSVGIGTMSPDSKLSVKGQIHAQEVKVDLNGAVAPDYVFAKDYKLPSLEEIQSYIEANQHLPEVPSAKEMEEKGINVGEMNLLLLKKVEELTLQLIELNEKVKNIENKDTDTKRRQRKQVGQ